jgi:hypothetical protein
MIFRGLDSSGDWLFGKGKSDYLRDLNAIKANIETRLKSWKGDCFFAPAEGVDYNNFLDIGTKDLLDLDVRRVLLQSDGVMRIDSFESSLDRGSRGYSAQAEVTTFYGDLTVGV